MPRNKNDPTKTTTRLRTFCSTKLWSSTSCIECSPILNAPKYMYPDLGKDPG